MTKLPNFSLKPAAIVLSAIILTACSDRHHDHDGHSHTDDIKTEGTSEISSQTSEDKHDDSHNVETSTQDHQDEDLHEGDRHDEDSMSIRQSDSHVHGDASLYMALDDTLLTIEFETPLYNILGFETEPKTDTQKDKVAKTEALLAMPNELFKFNSDARCIPSYPSMKIELFNSHDHQDDHHDESHQEDHDSHQDLLISYEFNCEMPDQLTSIEVDLFEHFSGLSALETVYLGPSTQLQTSLKSDRRQMKLTK